MQLKLTSLAGFAFGLALVASTSAFSATMQCAPSLQVSAMSGTSYTAAADGLVSSVANSDVLSLQQSGCVQVGIGGPTLVAFLRGANFNVTTDQTIPMVIPAGAYYIPYSMVVKNCSASLTTAKGQVYDAASKGGNVLFGSAVTQVFTSCTGAGTAETLAATSATGGTAGAVVDALTAPPILSLTTAQGGAATANVYVYGYVVGQ